MFRLGEQTARDVNAGSHRAPWWHNPVAVPEVKLMRQSILAMVLTTTAIAGAAIAHPGSSIAVSADGRVYFVDTGGGVFSIERNGSVVRREGPAFHWFAYDPAGRFARTPWPSVPGAEFRAAGTNPTLVLSSDFPVAITTDGAFCYTEATGGRIRIIAVAPSGSRSVRATLPPVLEAGKPVTWLNSLAAGPNGSLYYTDDAAVRKVDASGRVSLIANAVTVRNCAAIPGIEPPTRPYLRGLAVAPDGTVYVAASGCGAVLRIDPRGAIATVLTSTSPWSPTAVAVGNGEVYVLEYLHTASDDRREWLPRVRKVQRNGTVITLAATKGR
jgi:hypothetical protein